MTTQQKVEAIEKAFEDADEMQSPHAAKTYDVPALTSLKIRHLLNNLGALGTRYLEIGVHRGGTFTASVAGNYNLKYAYAVDSFESDERNEEKAMPDFVANGKKFLPESTKFKLIVSDSFEFDLTDIEEPIDHYLYDGDHKYESQKKALTHFLPILANEFIFIIDDWDWEEVSTGTADAIKECGLEVLYEKILKGDNHNNDQYWNGFAVYLLRKKQ